MSSFNFLIVTGSFATTVMLVKHEPMLHPCLHYLSLNFQISRLLKKLVHSYSTCWIHKPRSVCCLTDAVFTWKAAALIDNTWTLAHTRSHSCEPRCRQLVSTTKCTNAIILSHGYSGTLEQFSIVCTKNCDFVPVNLSYQGQSTLGWPRLGSGI